MIAAERFGLLAGEERRGHMSKVEEYIISIPDYPKPGIIFRDITSVRRDADGLRLAVDEMTQCIGDTQFDAIVGLESRGFLFGMPMAYNLHKAFIPVRKRGKLPGRPPISPMTWSMARRRSRSTKRISPPGCGWWWWTT